VTLPSRPTTSSMTAETLLAHYAAGERDFRGVHLKGANLAGADLAFVSLRDANRSSPSHGEA